MPSYWLFYFDTELAAVTMNDKYTFKYIYKNILIKLHKKISVYKIIHLMYPKKNIIDSYLFIFELINKNIL